ncbi:MAG: HlyD family efflux transporter periplasmic adaptor subunit [Clostridiaceae bacterium]|nr:HlyD family efflux transporter periplasmic adaptor subunit [Clostridiaceae bacterium]
MAQKVLMIVIIIIIIVGGGFYVYQQVIPPMEAETQGLVYATHKVERGDISVGVNTTGRLDPSEGGGIRVSDALRNIRTVTELIIDEVLADEGDEVARDGTVVRLTAPGLQDDITDLEDQIKREKEALVRLTDIEIKEVMNINPSLGVTIPAPIGGRVQGIGLAEGDEVSQGETIGRIVDSSSFKVSLNLTTTEYNTVKRGDNIKLHFPYFDGFEDATITRINTNPIPYSENSDEFGQSFVYRATAEGENRGLVQKGMSVRAGLDNEQGDINYFRNSSTVEGFVDEERMASTTEGLVAVVHVQEMEEVEAGDPIITLAGADVEEAIQKRLDKIRELESDLRQLYSVFDMLDVKSPMDGVLARIHRQEGESVGAGDWLGQVYTTAKMSMYTTVDDIDVLNISQGAPVRVTVDAIPDEIFEGEVQDVQTQWNDGSGPTRFMVYIEVKGGPQLRPGMQGQAFIDAGTAEDVLLVPIEGIFQEEGRYKAEVLDEKGVPSIVTVEVGLMNDRYAEIKSGLEEGDAVITGSSGDLLPTQSIDSGINIVPNNNREKSGEE